MGATFFSLSTSISEKQLSTMGFWTDTFCLSMASVYSFFGITLAISMRDFWGTNSPGLAYWYVPFDLFARRLHDIACKRYNYFLFFIPSITSPASIDL
jgi:uncharacterized membrane protein YhaH (DUF805 family)